MTQRPWEEWAAWDETVEGEVSTPPPEESRQWLGGQRFLHGLLRSLHTADASAKEARVQSILAAVDRDARGGTVLRWQWFAVAAVLAIAALLGFQLLGGEAALPKAEAMVGRAAENLAQAVDRTYTLTIEESGFGSPKRRYDYEITMRPGRFMLEGAGLLGTIRAGSDGEELWFQPGVRWGKRVVVPIAEAAKLDESLGDVIDQGFLDLDTFVERLPQRARLRTTGRIRGENGEPDRVRIAVRGLSQGARFRNWRVRNAFLEMREATGVVTRVVVEVVRPAAPRRPRRNLRLELNFQSESNLGEDVYRRPW